MIHLILRHFNATQKLCLARFFDAKLTRTKTSIRYAKENGRVKREERERKRGTRRDIEREGEIREKERESERERECE